MGAIPARFLLTATGDVVESQHGEIGAELHFRICEFVVIDVHLFAYALCILFFQLLWLFVFFVAINTGSSDTCGRNCHEKHKKSRKVNSHCRFVTFTSFIE